MDSKPRCRNCYETARCCCSKNYTNAVVDPPQQPVSFRPNLLGNLQGYPKSSISVKHAHSRERVQSLYDTPCASVVSVDHIMKPLRQLEREKWAPKYAFTSTTGLPLDGLLCDCCSPKGCRCPNQCPTCGQIVEEYLELQQKQSTFEKPTFCIACRRCRIGEKCVPLNYEGPIKRKASNRPPDKPPDSSSSICPPKVRCKTSQTTQIGPEPCPQKKVQSVALQTKRCSCHDSTPKSSRCKNLTMSENIIQMLLDKRDESLGLCSGSRETPQELKRRFGAGTDQKNETDESSSVQKPQTSHPAVTSTTDVIDSDSSSINAPASDADSKSPKKSAHEDVNKATPSDEFKSLKKDYIVQDVWGVRTDLGTSKFAHISKSKKYVSPQTGRVFNLNNIPVIPKIEIPDQVIPKPLSVHDLLILNPRKSQRANASAVQCAKGVSGCTSKIIASEFMALRGGTDNKKKPKAQKNSSDRFRFPNINLLFTTSETAPPDKLKDSSCEISGNSSELSNDSNHDDFLEKQVQEVLLKKKNKAGIIAQCAPSRINSTLSRIQDMVKSNHSKEILCTLSDAPTSRTTGGQDECCDAPHRKSSDRSEFTRSYQRCYKDEEPSLQQRILNFDDMVKTKLSGLIVGRLPDICDSEPAHCGRWFKKEKCNNFPEFRLPYVGCASKCRKFDDIVKSKLSSLILGQMPEVTLSCESSHCSERNQSIKKASSIMCSRTALCEPLDIRRLPCTNIPRALMRFDDIIKAKLSSAILGSYIAPESNTKSECSTHECHKPCIPARRVALASAGACSPKPSVPCQSAVTTPAPSPPCTPQCCTPKPSYTPPVCAPKPSRMWCAPPKCGSKSWSIDSCPSKIPSKTCTASLLKPCSSKMTSPCPSRPSTPCQNRVNFDIMNVPCIPSVCEMNSCCEPKRRRNCSSFTSICTTRCEQMPPQVCPMPMCVRDFRGPQFNFSCDYNRKRYRGVCKPCPAPCPTPCVPCPPCPPCQPCMPCMPCMSACQHDQCERPASGHAPSGKNPYLDPNWTASSTDVKNNASTGSMTDNSTMNLCPKLSSTVGTVCSSKYLSPCYESCKPCGTCCACVQSGIMTCAPLFDSSNFTRICTHKEKGRTQRCQPCTPYCRPSCPRSAPCRSPCNPYMDYNWTSSPSMQCIGFESQDNMMGGAPNNAATYQMARHNDHWCYYYSLGRTDDFIEYPPIPQSSVLSPDDFDFSLGRESECSLDTIFSILAVNTDDQFSESSVTNSTRTLQAEESTSTAGGIVDNGRRTIEKAEITEIVNKTQQTDDPDITPKPSQDTFQKVHKIYKDTIISYCFISEIPAFARKTNTPRESKSTTSTNTSSETVTRFESARQVQDYSAGCVYQDDFVAETFRPCHDQTDEKFNKAVKKFCSLARASTILKQKTKQTSIKISGDIRDTREGSYSVRMTKEIYNIELEFMRKIGEKRKSKERKLSTSSRKCSSLLTLSSKNNDSRNDILKNIALESTNSTKSYRKDSEKILDDINDTIPSRTFAMSHAFPIIRGRVWPSYKPTCKAKPRKYVRLIKDISEFRDDRTHN